MKNFKVVSVPVGFAAISSAIFIATLLGPWSFAATAVPTKPIGLSCIIQEGNGGPGAKEIPMVGTPDGNSDVGFTYRSTIFPNYKVDAHVEYNLPPPFTAADRNVYINVDTGPTMLVAQGDKTATFVAYDKINGLKVFAVQCHSVN